MEHCRKFLDHLISVMVTLNLCNRIPNPIFRLAFDRIQAFRRKIERLTARIEAGTFVPRKKTGPREKKAVRPPWQPRRLPTHRGWLAELLTDNDKVHMNFAPGMRGWLGRMLREPEMIALMETAPAEMARPIRSLIWMLNFPKHEIPEILRRPKKPCKPRAKPVEPAMTAEERRIAKAKWAKPRGSISNRIYRDYIPPGDRPPRKTA
jgi:hypothetical protein